MKKEEIKKFLSETKVYVNGKSKEIQEKLFSLGCGWTGGDDIHGITYTSKPFLYIDDELNLTCGIDMTHFTKHRNREITAEEILSLDPPTYRPFKNKEECWNEMIKHQPIGWIKNEFDNIFNIITIINDSIKIHECFTNYPTLCERFKFMDGTPFGIKEE